MNCEIGKESCNNSVCITAEETYENFYRYIPNEGNRLERVISKMSEWRNLVGCHGGPLCVPLIQLMSRLGEYEDKSTPNGI